MQSTVGTFFVIGLVGFAVRFSDGKAYKDEEFHNGRDTVGYDQGFIPAENEPKIQLEQNQRYSLQNQPQTNEQDTEKEQQIKTSEEMKIQDEPQTRELKYDQHIIKQGSKSYKLENPIKIEVQKSQEILGSIAPSLWTREGGAEAGKGRGLGFTLSKLRESFKFKSAPNAGPAEKPTWLSSIRKSLGSFNPTSFKNLGRQATGGQKSPVQWTKIPITKEEESDESDLRRSSYSDGTSSSDSSPQSKRRRQSSPNRPGYMSPLKLPSPQKPSSPGGYRSQSSTPSPLSSRIRSALSRKFSRKSSSSSIGSPSGKRPPSPGRSPSADMYLSSDEYQSSSRPPSPGRPPSSDGYQSSGGPPSPNRSPYSDGYRSSSRPPSPNRSPSSSRSHSPNRSPSSRRSPSPNGSRQQSPGLEEEGAETEWEDDYYEDYDYDMQDSQRQSPRNRYQEDSATDEEAEIHVNHRNGRPSFQKKSNAQKTDYRFQAA